MSRATTLPGDHAKGKHIVSKIPEDSEVKRQFLCDINVLDIPRSEIVDCCVGIMGDKDEATILGLDDETNKIKVKNKKPFSIWDISPTNYIREKTINMSGISTSTRYGDTPAGEYILHETFNNHPAIRELFKTEGVRLTPNDIRDFCKDCEDPIKQNTLKWKSGKEDLPDLAKELIANYCSFIKYSQNQWALLENSKVDDDENGLRTLIYRRFRRFVHDGHGQVKYDPDIAFKWERINFPHGVPPSIIASGTRVDTPYEEEDGDIDGDNTYENIDDIQADNNIILPYGNDANSSDGSIIISTTVNGGIYLFTRRWRR